MVAPNALTHIGLGARKWHQDKAPIQTCEEMLIPGCEYESPTDACCKIGPCKFCLYWEVYGETDDTGTAAWSGTEWFGRAGGINFTAYIAKVDDVCKFIVELNSVEVYSVELCGYGESETCRSLDGSVEYTNVGSYTSEEGTFRWEKKTVHELQKRLGDNSYGSVQHCARPFCGDPGECECTCDELCVTVSVEGGDECTGLIPQTGTFCGGKLTAPEWSGDIACVPSGDTITATVTLGRDEYTDDCILYGGVVGSIGGDSVDLNLEETTVSGCESLSASWVISVGYVDYFITVKCADCGGCEPEICLECCDSVPPSPPATLVARISIAAVNNIPGEPLIDTSCWENIVFDISFVYDVDDDTNQACANQGATRRADCIGNLLDNEFNEECCSGGQWIGSGSNGCGKISICFIPCATSSCPTPPPGETLNPWHALMSVGDAQCDETAECLICHDPIAYSQYGYRACSSVLFTVGTGSIDLQVDISES